MNDLRVNEQPGANPGVSVCMIVKDEGHQILEAVGNFLSFADEIIVIDTGDGKTINKISFDLRVKCFHHATDDFRFDEARNYSISKASRNWIMWLDADDRIQASEAIKLKQLFSLNPAQDRFFQTKVINTINGLPIGQQFIQTRIFPNVPKVEFKGSIHESAVQSLVDLGLRLIKLDVCIHHTGYESESERIRKARRNIMFLEREPDSARKFKAIADCLMNLNEWDNAIKFFSESAKHSTCDPELSDYLNISIGLCLMKKNDFSSALNSFTKVLETTPDSIDALFYAGKCYEERRFFKTATNHYEAAMKAPDVYSIYSSNYHYTKCLSYYHAARISACRGSENKAVELFKYISETYPTMAVE